MSEELRQNDLSNPCRVFEEEVLSIITPANDVRVLVLLRVVRLLMRSNKELVVIPLVGWRAWRGTAFGVCCWEGSFESAFVRWREHLTDRTFLTFGQRFAFWDNLFDYCYCILESKAIIKFKQDNSIMIMSVDFCCLTIFRFIKLHRIHIFII